MKNVIHGTRRVGLAFLGARAFKRREVFDSRQPVARAAALYVHKRARFNRVQNVARRCARALHSVRRSIRISSASCFRGASATVAAKLPVELSR
jgi:hypothetical protein